MKINEGEYAEAIYAKTHVWYEKDWKHDEPHSHAYFQLNYVEQGYQYFHIENKIYLVPQNHVIWIPANKTHFTTSESRKVNPMVLLFQSTFDDEFYNKVHVFSAPMVLKEMMFYASKWNKMLDVDQEQNIFLEALLFSLPNFCHENNSLQLPVLVDNRLISVSEYININYPYNLDIEDLAEEAKMSVRNLQRVFKNETGITIQKYMQLMRILKSVELIDTMNYTLSEIAYKVGYKSLSAFTTSYYSVMKAKPKLKKKN